MTIFHELEKLALQFGAIGKVNVGTDPGSLMELAEQALRFVQRSEDVCPAQDCSGKSRELDQVRACALQMQHHLRKLQSRTTLRSFVGLPSEAAQVSTMYQALFEACKTTCAAHNCILVEWWDVASNHA